MPTLPVNVVAGQTGHIAHSNELHGMFNESGGTVDFVRRYDPTSTTVGTDETVKLQAAIDENNGKTIDLGGLYDISAPLIAHTGTRLRNGVIRAAAGFDFSQTVTDAVGGVHPVAMLMLENGGFVYSLGRIYLDRVQLHGMSRANSRGFLGALQQPTEWFRPRFDQCLDYGMKIKGQQASFNNLIALDCGIGVLLDNFSFGRFFAFNVEGNGTGLKALSAADTEIYGGHYEGNDIDVHITGGNNYQFYGARHTSVTGNISFKIEAGRPTGYRIIRAQSATATNTGTAIQDVDRSLTYQWWTDFRGNIHDFEALEVPTSSTFTDPLGKVTVSRDGRIVRFGGRYSSTFAIQAGTSTQLQAEFLDSSLARRFNIGAAGNAALGVYSNATRPAAASVPVGTVIINSDSNAINVHSGGIWRDALGNVL